MIQSAPGLERRILEAAFRSRGDPKWIYVRGRGLPGAEVRAGGAEFDGIRAIEAVDSLVSKGQASRVRATAEFEEIMLTPLGKSIAAQNEEVEP